MKLIKLWGNIPGMCETEPTFEYYPAENKKTKGTIIILPGGAYANLAEHEGKGYAEFLNKIGMDAFVLKYRVAPHRYPTSLLDVRRAIQVVRAKSEEFGIDPEKIGVMGSSAGGHLAASVSTITDEFPELFTKKDEIDKIDFMPNFQVLCYPVIALNDFGHVGSGDNLLGHTDVYNPQRYYLSLQNRVCEKTPIAFIWHTVTDPAVPIQNSLSYVSALRAKGIASELHVFPYGGHGLGLDEGDPHINQWTKLLENWLILNKFL